MSGAAEGKLGTCRGRGSAASGLSLWTIFWAMVHLTLVKPVDLSQNNIFKCIK